MLKSKFTFIVQEKIAKFKKNLDGCSSTLEFFLVNNGHISILPIDVIFCTLTKVI